MAFGVVIGNSKVNRPSAAQKPAGRPQRGLSGFVDHDQRVPAYLQDVLARLDSDNFFLTDELAGPVVDFFSSIGRRDSGDAPRLLILTGPPGSGKSTIVESIAETLDVKLLRFSLADTESHRAGGPSDRLRTVACEADRLESQGWRVIVLVDDAELGFGVPRDGEGSSTNRPQLQGLLQELIDGRHVVNGRQLGAKYFAFTTNDASQLRPSILREARSYVVEHKPNASQRAHIAQRLLAPLVARPALRHRLRQLGQLSVAELVAVRKGLRRRIERMLVHDMDYETYRAWMRHAAAAELVDAVARRTLNHRDLADEISAIRSRKRARQSYL